MPVPFNFSWFVEGKLAGLGYPRASDFPFLVEVGIKRLVNITEHEPDYHKAAAENGVTIYNICVEDFCPPSVKQIQEFLGILDSSNEPLGVHCAMGRGRTGTLLACYLIAKEGYTADQAIEETRKRRPFSIETRKQEDVIHEFQAVFRRGP